MLHELSKITSKPKKRVGRGEGSGKGMHTVGRGTKGHKAREGKPMPLWFEGGQLPLIKRLPYWRGKFHFRSLNKKPVVIQLGRLSLFEGADVTPETLVSKGMLATIHTPVKLVGGGEVPKIKEVRGVKMSAPARAALEKIGTIIN